MTAALGQDDEEIPTTLITPSTPTAGGKINGIGKATLDKLADAATG